MPAVLYPPARPQSIGQVLDSAFRLFQASLLKCLPFGILSMIAGQTANIYHLAIGRPLRSFGGGDPVWWGLYLLGVCASILFLAATILRQWHFVSGQAVSARAELSESLRKLPALLAASILIGASIVLGLALLVLPGLYLMTALSPAWMALLIGGRGPLAALTDSVRLVSGNWWRSALVLSVTFIVALVFYIVAFTLVAIVLPLLGTSDVAVFTAVSVVIMMVLGAVGTPFLTAVLLALYGDLQLRTVDKAPLGQTAAAAGG